jgi:hypothetical protein
MTKKDNFKTLTYILKEDDQETVQVLDRAKKMITSLSTHIKSHKCFQPTQSEYYTVNKHVTAKFEDSKISPKSKELPFDYSRIIINSEKGLNEVLQNTTNQSQDLSEVLSELGVEEQQESESDINDDTNVDIDDEQDENILIPKMKKFINNSNFNASKSDEQLLTIDDSDFMKTNRRYMYQPESDEFMKDTSVTDPIPEVLTPELQSSNYPTPKEESKVIVSDSPFKQEIYENHNFDLRKESLIEDQNMTNPLPEIAEEKRNLESSQVMEYCLSQEHEIQKESVTKDVDAFIATIDEYISDDLPMKHKDLKNIKSNISKIFTSSVDEIYKAFNTNAEKIMSSIIMLQKTHTIIVEEKKQFETKNNELKVK